MDFWKQMDILHKYQKIMNPISESKLETFIGLLQLKPGSRVLDIACGKGELLFKLAEKYQINGVGIDKSPYCIEDCNQNKLQRAQSSSIVFHLMDGADYKPDAKFDLSCCIGASFVYGNHKNTLKALSVMTQPGGLILVGNPTWLREPDPEYLKAEEMTRDSYKTHIENIKTGEDLGLRCIYTVDGDREGFDYSESLHWWAAEDYMASNPNDPDLPEIRSVNDRYKEIYLRWGRDTLGWCIYLFRNH